MQVNAESEGSTHQTSISMLSGIVDRAVVRGILPGQHQQQQGRWDYTEVEEMDMQLQALTFMANQERERVKKAEKKQLQHAREPREVALTDM